MSALSELSILIVTWNGDELLKNCLDSVRRACGTEPEIVVVDNANLESTKVIVATHPNAQYIAAPENLGFAGGNNLGLPLCTRPYILLLNNDTIVHEEPFTQLIQYLKDHPKVAVVQGKMRLVRFGDVLDECGSYLTSWGEVYSRGLMMPVSTHIPSGPSYHAKGACLMFKHEIIDTLGGILFHNHFKSNYEDVDFCHRVWLTGNEVHFVNTPLVDHLQGMTVSRINGNKFDALGEANRWFSFATAFNNPYRLTIGFKRRFMILAIFFRYILTFNIRVANHYFDVWRIFKTKKGLIPLTRDTVSRIRKLSDKQIVSRILVKPPLSFYYRNLTGAKPSDLFDPTLHPNDVA